MAVKMTKPFLVGADIYLRPLERDDLTGEYRNWINDSEVTAFTSAGAFPITDDEMVWYYESNLKGAAVLFAIVEASTGRHVGNARIYEIDWIARKASRGIMLNKPAWGKGYGLQVINLLSDYVFNTLGLNKLKSSTVVGNEGIKKVNERAGYKQEGLTKQEFYRGGRFYDMYVWGLTRDDYDKLRNS